MIALTWSHRSSRFWLAASPLLKKPLRSSKNCSPLLNWSGWRRGRSQWNPAEPTTAARLVGRGWHPADPVCAILTFNRDGTLFATEGLSVQGSWTLHGDELIKYAGALGVTKARITELTATELCLLRVEDAEEDTTCYQRLPA